MPPLTHPTILFVLLMWVNFARLVSWIMGRMPLLWRTRLLWRMNVPRRTPREQR